MAEGGSRGEEIGARFLGVIGGVPKDGVRFLVTTFDVCVDGGAWSFCIAANWSSTAMVSSDSASPIVKLESAGPDAAGDAACQATLSL